MAQITVKNLSAYYENREIFKDMSFSVDKGDYLCITGDNGSGKTTLMRLLLGFPVKHTGSVLFEGDKKIGWLSQSNEVRSDFPASVFEVVLSGFAGKSFFGTFYTKKQKSAAVECMKKLEIENLKDRAFCELSGGQRQRVRLCRCLVADCSILFLDEPVTGLDSDSVSEMYSIIKKLNSEGITVVMITHDISRAKSDAKHILNIADDGYIFCDSKGWENL